MNALLIRVTDETRAAIAHIAKERGQSLSRVSEGLIRDGLLWDAMKDDAIRARIMRTTPETK